MGTAANILPLLRSKSLYKEPNLRMISVVSKDLNLKNMPTDTAIGKPTQTPQKKNIVKLFTIRLAFEN